MNQLSPGLYMYVYIYIYISFIVFYAMHFSKCYFKHNRTQWYWTKAWTYIHWSKPWNQIACLVPGCGHTLLRANWIGQGPCGNFLYMWLDLRWLSAPLEYNIFTSHARCIQIVSHIYFNNFFSFGDTWSGERWPRKDYTELRMFMNFFSYTLQSE